MYINENINCFHRIIFSLVFTIAIGCSNDKEEIPSPETMSEAIQLHLENNQSPNSPGISVFIKHQNEVYVAGRGLAQLSPAFQIDESTQFRTASVTKPITAVAILTLVENQLLNLDDFLVDYIPNLPNSYSAITIRHLLLHSSGLLDFIDDNTDQSGLDNFSNEDLINSLPTSGLDVLQFPPGNGGDYSNTGYALLASVIEKASGMSYPEYLSAKIFEPTGMVNSYVITQDIQLGDHGNNYALSFGETHLINGYNSVIYGPNGVVSTVWDLSLFIEAFDGGLIVSEMNKDVMIQAQSSLPGIADYGLGWMTGEGNYWHTEVYTNSTDYWHTGGYDGFRSVLYHSPELELTVIILTNNGDTSQQIMFDILELARNYAK